MRLASKKIINIVTISICVYVIVATIKYIRIGHKLHVQDRRNLSYIIDNNVTNYTIPSVLQCNDIELVKSAKQRGTFFVLYNFVSANKHFHCDETITLTSPSDFRFLDNVVPLLERWNGPISIALYAPGNDFNITVKSIAYLRSCTSSLVKELVSFHVFFESYHFPTGFSIPLLNAYEDYYSCSKIAPYKNYTPENTYKVRKKLLFPINVARNIARESAQTYFIFPSDIELYPTKNFIPQFLSLIKRNSSLLEMEKRNVFVLPIFEILDNATIPQNKSELQKMLKNQTAQLFHAQVCAHCHRVPAYHEWLNQNESNKLNVFCSGKRSGKYKFWEPFYVGTQSEPLFDERLTWEGQSNKMSQAYSLCLLDYNFLVLDNAFLVHKPGVKKKKEQLEKYINEVKKTNFNLKTIKKQLMTLYGVNTNC